MSVNLEDDELDELTKEIRRQIEGNRVFLERVLDEDFPEEEGESEAEEEVSPEDFEEL